MNFVGVPDLLTAGQSSRTISRVSQDLDRVSQELASGLQSNLVKASGGDPTRLYSIDQELRMNDVRRFSVAQAQGRSEVTQSALGRIQAAVSDFGAPLLSAVTINDQQGAEIVASSARNAFSEVVSALNSRFGDRSLFAGAATDGPAVADADAILAEIATLIAGAATALARAVWSPTQILPTRIISSVWRSLRRGSSLLEQRTGAPGRSKPSMLPGFGQWTVSVRPSRVSTSAKKRL